MTWDVPKGSSKKAGLSFGSIFQCLVAAMTAPGTTQLLVSKYGTFEVTFRKNEDETGNRAGQV